MNLLYNLSIKYYLILGILFLTFYARTIFPFAGKVNDVILIVELLIFFFIVLISLSFQSFLSFKLEGTNKLFLLLFSIAIFSFCYSFVVNLQYNLNTKAISKTISYFIVTITFVTILARKMYYDNKFFEFILSGLLVFGIVSSLFSVLMFFAGYHPIPLYSSSTTGFFAHPNTTSLLYTIVTPILFYKYFTKKISLSTFVITLLLFIFCLLFTFSRAGYLGVFLGMLVFTYNKSKKIFFATLVILLLIVSNIFLEFALSKTDSSIGRALLIITAIQMIIADQSSFLWGYGVYNFSEVFQSEKIFLGSFEIVVDPHNLILLLGIQFGMIFTISVLLIISVIILKNFFKISKNKLADNKNRVNLCLSITLGLLIQNMLEDLIFYPEYFVMPLFLMFLGYLYYNITPPEKTNGSSILYNQNN